MMTKGSVENKRRRLVGHAGLLVLLASSTLAAEGPSWRIERGDVRIMVPLKPGGAFTATTPFLNGNVTLEVGKPSRLVGEISVDLATIDTGINLRNRHLREKYLEVAKGEGFNKAVLSEIHLDDADSAGFEGSTGFTGTMLLHGTKQQVTGKAEIHPNGPGRQVRAEFPLVLTDFGVTPPEYLGVGVGSRLIVKVAFTAMPARVSSLVSP